MRKVPENEILNFDNWSKPWTFCQTITDNLFDSQDINTFNQIWNEASDFNLWNHSDLILGCKMSQNFIREKYGLDDKVISAIVRAISSEWR